MDNTTPTKDQPTVDVTGGEPPVAVAPPAQEQVTSVELVDQWRGGDQRAANELHERYLARLVNLAKRHLNEKFNARVDPDDLVQSIFRSVFRITRNRGIDFNDDTGFWKWLSSVALNKTYKRLQYMQTLSRTPDRERGSSEFVDASAAAHHGTMPTTAEVVEFADLLESILANLETIDQQIFQLRLEGYTQHEIAERLVIDVRTVRRHMNVIRQRVSEALDGELPPELT